ncbi:MAG: hypothetical protein H7Z72_01795, partial [Bacteroidetes bacterium]|nr:hypothetical protein [Fibrella sp.]
ILSNLGQRYHKIGQYNMAISFNNQSFQAAAQASSLRGMSVAAWALGNDYAAQKKTTPADHWYQESIRQAHRAADYDAAILNYPALFTLHHPRQPVLALTYLTEGVRQMETQQARISTYAKRLFTEQQATIYFQLGQYRRAVESHRLLERINREIAEKEKQQRLYMLQAYYENERQQLRQQASERVRQGELRRNQQVALAAGGVALLLLIALIAVYYGYRQQQTVKDLLQQQRIRELEQKQEITTLKAMMTGEERERVRIARELHDGLSGLLAAARYQVEGYFRATQTSPDATAPLSLLDEASQEVRRISHNLMPYALQQHGFVGALREYTSSLSGPDTPQLQFVPTGPDPALPATAELWLYRCAQELIGNALRHAHATIISVRLQTEPDQFCLSVTDDGHGFNPDRAYDGNGLRNIRMRLSHLGGQLSVQSGPAQGSILSLYLPLTVTPPTP